MNKNGTPTWTRTKNSRLEICGYIPLTMEADIVVVSDYKYTNIF